MGHREEPTALFISILHTLKITKRVISTKKLLGSLVDLLTSVPFCDVLSVPSSFAGARVISIQNVGFPFCRSALFGKLL
jgi:hypothetical protein